MHYSILIQKIFGNERRYFFNVDLNDLYAFQKSKMADCTLALKPMQHTDRYGLVKINAADEIESFEEKKKIQVV